MPGFRDQNLDAELYTEVLKVQMTTGNDTGKSVLAFHYGTTKPILRRVGMLRVVAK